MRKSTEPRQDPVEELVASDRPWWQRYSSHGELPWSTLTSMVLHLFALLVIIVLSMQIIRRDPTPPAVDVVAVVGEEEESVIAESDDALDKEPLVSSEPTPSMADVPEEMETAKLDRPPEAAPVDVDLDPDAIGQGATAAQSSMKEAAARMRNALDNLRKNLDRRKKGRAGRQARWVLVHPGGDIHELAAEMDGLGATIAFPSDDGQWTYYDHLSAPSPHSYDRDLGEEDRIFWSWEGDEWPRKLARLVGREYTGRMLTFLPYELEERMAEMERAYQNLEEDEVKSTRFESFQRDGRWDVKVVKQEPK